MSSSSPAWRREPNEVRRRLAEIGGLTVETLHEVAAQGEIGRSGATSNHPRLAGPLMAYFDATRALRDLLMPAGWMKSNFGGSELTVSPDRQHAIMVAAGDENTGSPVFAATTKSPKGPRTHLAVAQNAVQTNFLAELGYEDPVAEMIIGSMASGAAPYTWVLLIRRDDYEIQVELSLPVRMGPDGRPELFSERIILPPLDLNNNSHFGGRGPEPGPDFDIDVIPRHF
jgi:hypothetical protein